MVVALSRRLVPDELLALVEPLMPSFVARPQGGGRAPVADRAVFAAVVYVLTSGCPWRLLPPSFGVTVPTAHRRFTEWTKAGLWRRLHQVVLDELGSEWLIDWSTIFRKKRDLPPVPSPVTGEVEARLIALACSRPPEGYARWSLRLLEKHVELTEDIPNLDHSTFVTRGPPGRAKTPARTANTSGAAPARSSCGQSLCAGGVVSTPSPSEPRSTGPGK